MAEPIAMRDWAAMERRLAELEGELRMLRWNEEQRRLILESATDYAIFTIDSKGFVTSWNAGAERILGYREEEILGHDGRVIFTPEDRQAGAADREIATARKEGRAENERWHLRKDGSRFWGSGLVMTLKMGDPGFLKIMRDDTDRRRSDELRKLLIGELNHRVKNMLAMVRSLADQTLINVDSLEAFRTAFTGRLFALSGAHDMLTRETWVSADLSRVVQSALEVFADDQRLSIEGPAFDVGPKQALALSMAFHELATNATKYGALGVPGGRVQLHWHMVDESCEIRWIERNGPPVETPKRQGFGMRILKRALAMELNQPVELSFEPEGLTCIIRIPISRAEAL